MSTCGGWKISIVPEIQPEKTLLFENRESKEADKRAYYTEFRSDIGLNLKIQLR